MQSKDTSFGSASICSDERRQCLNADGNHVIKRSSNSNTNISSHQNPMHKFYITRLKHSLIISFLFLIPIQNLFLFFILQFSEKVSCKFWRNFNKSINSICICMICQLKRDYDDHEYFHINNKIIDKPKNFLTCQMKWKIHILDNDMIFYTNA